MRPPAIRTKTHDNTSLIRGDGMDAAPDDELVASIRDKLKYLRGQAGLSLEGVL